MIKDSYTVRLVFEGDTQETITRLATEDYPNRTGGILVGRYTDENSCACVTRILPPPPGSRIGPDEFYRGVEGLNKMLEECWNGPERSYYLGEWHSRPVSRRISPLDGLPLDISKINADPSALDIESMIEIAEDKDMNCPEPVLAILGIWTNEHEKPDTPMSQTNLGVFGFARGETDFVRFQGFGSN